MLKRLRGLRRARPDHAQMTVFEHLGELRRRLIISMAAVAIAAVVAFFLSLRIIDFLVDYYREATGNPDEQLIFLGPTDAFATRLKIATYAGIILAVPVWLYQLWRFVTPGLHPRERRYAVPFVASSVLLFALGAWVALLTMPRALEFLLTLGGDELEATLSADRYLSFVSLMTLAFGLAFEFPLLLVFLLLARIITTAQLRHWRRGAAVGITVFAAVITPSQDPYSLVFMAVPMYVLFEASILVGRLLKR